MTCCRRILHVRNSISRSLESSRGIETLLLLRFFRQPGGQTLLKSAGTEAHGRCGDRAAAWTRRWHSQRAADLAAVCSNWCHRACHLGFRVYGLGVHLQSHVRVAAAVAERILCGMAPAMSVALITMHLVECILLNACRRRGGWRMRWWSGCWAQRWRTRRFPCGGRCCAPWSATPPLIRCWRRPTGAPSTSWLGNGVELLHAPEHGQALDKLLAQADLIFLGLGFRV